MNSSDLYCVSRVRVLALDAMAAAGGRPTAWQLLRSLEPVLRGSVVLGSELPERLGRAAGDRPGQSVAGLGSRRRCC